MSVYLFSLEYFVTDKLSRVFMKEDYGSPKDTDPTLLWAHLKSNYKDGSSLVDEDSNIWDVWRKGSGYALYCAGTKEVIEVPKPESLGG